MVKFQTKCVQDPASRGDGFRVLVTRRWPRGVRMTDVNLWLKDLGPTRALMSDYQTGKVRWPTFSRRYLEELESEGARKAMIVLAQGIQGRTVTLLCACEDLKRCHTALLKKFLMKLAGSLGKRR